MADQLVGGQRFRLLQLVDNHSRESLAIEVGQRLTGDDVVRVLERVSMVRESRRQFESITVPSSSRRAWICGRTSTA